MEDKLPNRFIGSFIALVGTGIILRFLSSLVDRVFFSNSEFKIVEHEYFGIFIFVIAIGVTISWLIKTKDLRKKD
tara:strand:+ start:68 stop:292 length:225 start_codon:yes stop_codon:yes gene_type:complete